MKTNNIDWVIAPKNSKGGLAIANIRYFNNQSISKDNVVGVISVFGEKQLDLPNQIDHLRILINDNPKEDISLFFSTTYTYIEDKIKKGNVVVHCHAGVSRSASIVIAYIIRKQRLSFEQAFKMVQQKRPIICPNKGFTKQLRKFAQEVKQMPIQQEKGYCVIF